MTITPKRAPGAPVYIVHAVPGLEALAADELRSTVKGAAVLETLRGFDERTSLLLVRFRGEPAELLALQLSEDVFALALDATDVPSAWGGLRALRTLIEKERGVETAVIRATPMRPARARKATFRVITRIAGRYAYKRQDLQRAAEQALAERFSEWRLVEDGARFEFWLNLVGGRVLLGVRLSDETMRRHTALRVSLPAALKPVVATAMVRLSDPTPDDIFLDPMCGVGTLLIERGESGRYRQLIGGDLDPEGVEAARTNIGPRYKPVELRQWDARYLPLADASVTRIVTNLPFGKQIGTPEELHALYPALLSEWERVLQPGGRMVLLTSAERTLQTALRRHPRLTLARRVPVLIRGEQAAIFVLKLREA